MNNFSDFASPSYHTGDYTYHFSKLSCMREFYFIHMVMNYFIFLSGIACFLTRLVPRFSWLHKYFGKAYVVSMLLSTASSMLIHNSGLPLAVLYSFTWVIGGLTFGWAVITLHQARIQAAAMQQVQEEIVKNGGLMDKTLGEAIGKAKADLITKRSPFERVFSLKTLHGALFFTSWFNISGRMFASDQSGAFQCHTYPAYKNIDTKYHNGTTDAFTLLPEIDPKASRLPWYGWELGFALVQLFGPLVVAYAVAGVNAMVKAKAVRVKSVPEPQVPAHSSAF